MNINSFYWNTKLFVVNVRFSSLEINLFIIRNNNEITKNYIYNNNNNKMIFILSILIIQKFPFKDLI